MSGLPDQYFEPQAMEDEAGETLSEHQILPAGRSLSPHERQLWSELYGEYEQVLKTSSSSMNIVSASPPGVSGSSEDLHQSELQTMELGRLGYHQNMESSVTTVVSTQASETLVLDASLPCTASTIKAQLHSPQNAQQILATRAMRGAHTARRSCRDLTSSQTANSGNSRVPRASSRTRTSPLGQPRRSQRIISRAISEHDGQTGAFARTSVPKMPPQKGLEPPPVSTSMEWEEAIYVPAWEVFNPIVLHFCTLHRKPHYFKCIKVLNRDLARLKRICVLPFFLCFQGIISAKYQERLVLLTKAKVYVSPYTISLLTPIILLST